MIEPATKEALQNALNSKYEEGVVEVNNVTISNIDFDESYNQAIADKQNAQLAYEKQQIENQTLVEKHRLKPTQRVIAAQGEAEANKTKQSTLTDEIIKISGSKSGMASCEFPLSVLTHRISWSV